MFKDPSWKAALFIISLRFAFAAGVLAGSWQIGEGFYEGPNYAANRVVIIDQVGHWRAEGNGSRYWTVDYHFTSGSGETLHGHTQVTAQDAGASRVEEAERGDEVLLRVGVPGGEADARFVFNTQVRQGLTVVCLLLVLGYFSRQDFLEIDAASGKVFVSKRQLLRFLLAFFGTLFGLLWLCSPVIR